MRWYWSSYLPSMSANNCTTVVTLTVWPSLFVVLFGDVCEVVIIVVSLLEVKVSGQRVWTGQAHIPQSHNYLPFEGR